MSYYKTCPHCGANLDPGEVCDCTLTQVCAEARETFPERFTGKTDREVVAEITWTPLAPVFRALRTSPVNLTAVAISCRIFI